MQALLENGLLRKDDHLLDFGCGPGGFTCAMAQHVKSAVGVDATAEMIDVARQARAHVRDLLVAFSPRSALTLTGASTIGTGTSALCYSPAGFKCDVFQD
jgi:tRNA/tmRNA/rRNA uracil-C5-methylase (TrmA/RlmC/RlmD family)